MRKDHRVQTVAITGANGFIGRQLVAHLAMCGYDIVALERNPEKKDSANIRYKMFNLEDADKLDLNGIDVLIHTAYQPVTELNEANINISALRTLIAQGANTNTKIIFFSTLSAHPNAESVYGRSKLLMESMIDDKQHLILRIGLVLGGGGGLFGKITEMLSKAKFIPLIAGEKMIQTIALDDLSRIVEQSIKNDIRGKFNIAHPQKITLRTLYTEIARSLNRSPIFIPVPLILILTILRVTERLHIKLPFSSENVLGLKCLETFDIPKINELFSVDIKDHQLTLQSLKITDSQ